jgi:hypothetical protein
VSVRLCVAVGEHSDFAGALIERWNGQKWAIRPAPNSQSWNLTGVSCPSADFCIAVGVRNAPPASHGVPTGSLVERWDGRRWARVEAPSQRSDVLWNVSCATARMCVAVGEENSPYRYIAERWDGSRWHRTTLGQPPTRAYVLVGVSCPTVDDCIVVGGDQGANNVIERLHDTHWTQSTLQDVNGSLRTVDCTTATHCMAGGAAYVPDTHSYPALAASWDGLSWTPVFIPARKGYTGSIAAISCPSAALCVALGDTGYVWTQRG